MHRNAARLAPALLVLAFAFPAFAEDATIDVTSRVAHVTVYPDRALVERTARTAIPAGNSRLVLAGLPDGFDATSLRARSPDVRILGIDSERVHQAQTQSRRVEEARAALTAARRTLAAADMDLVDAKDEWERLRSIRAATAARTGESLGRGDASSLEQTLDLIAKRSADARRRVQEAQDAFDAAKLAADVAQRRFQEVESAAGTVETRVVVTVTAAAAVADAGITVQYMVGNASWQPTYDLRVGEDFGSATVELNAVVTQRSGEDWRGVQMEFTTAQPAAGAAPPEPTAWTIDLFDPRSRGMVMQDAGAAGPPAAFVARKEKAEDAPNDEWRAPVRRSGLVVAFQSVLPGDVGSDGRATRVALGRWNLDPKVRWDAFPRSTEKVFVTAKVKNTTGAPLPAGQARVFVGPDYMGPMALEDWQIAKEIDIGLGVDRDVEVERETLADERSTEGVFSKDTVHARGYRITVKNHRAKPIDLRLLDQVPVSRDEELKVAMTDLSIPLATLPAAEAETNRARGVLEWRFPVASGAETVLRFAWRTTHPQGRQVVGLGD